MADHEVSKIMWVAIVVALAASVFTIAKPEIKTLAGGVFDKVEQVVDGINTGDSNNENGGDENGGEDIVSGINKVPASPHSPESDINTPGKDVITDESKYVEAGAMGFGASDNARYGIDAKGNAYIFSSDDQPITINVGGAGSGEAWNTRLGNEDVKTITFATTTKIDTSETGGNIAASIFGNKTNISFLDVTNVDIAGVKDLGNMFGGDYNQMDQTKGLQYLEGLNAWNIKDVAESTDSDPSASGLNHLFENASPVIKSIPGIESWKLSDTMKANSKYMFGGMKYTELPSWATQDMKDIAQQSMFN